MAIKTKLIYNIIKQLSFSASEDKAVDSLLIAECTRLYVKFVKGKGVSGPDGPEAKV